MRAVPDCTLAMGYYLIDFSNFTEGDSRLKAAGSCVVG